MTNQLRLIFLICFLSLSAQAASSNASFGIIGAYNSFTSTNFTLTQTGVNLNETPGTASGYGGGIVGVFPIGSGTLSLEARALYISEGTSTSTSGTISSLTTTGTVTATVPYIEIPILLDISVSPNFIFQFGGFYNSPVGNISTTQNLVVGGSSQNSTSSSTNTANDYGVTGGVEFILNPTSTTRLFISADYLYGLGNLNSGTAGATTSASRVIQGSVGLLFPL